MKPKTIRIRAIGFLALLTAVIQLLSPVFTPKNEPGSILDEPVNSLDYLVIGDSECYTSISPMELWKSCGFAGYDCGVSAQRIQDAYYQLEKTLRRQTPKVILLETNLIFRNRGLRQETVTAFDHYVGNAVGLYEYHNNWKQLIAVGSAAALRQSVFKGMRYRTGASPYTGGAYMAGTDKKQPIGEVQEIYLDKIAGLCREKNIRLVLYSVPSPRNWNQKKHNSVAEYARQNKLTFLDLNLIADKLGIDWSKDTYDRGDHLNFSGAQKVTSYIGSYLSDRIGLPDHRGEAAYSAWDRDLGAYLKSTGQAA
jgi:hypothetical protein